MAALLSRPPCPDAPPAHRLAASERWRNDRNGAGQRDCKSGPSPCACAGGGGGGGGGARGGIYPALSLREAEPSPDYEYGGESGLGRAAAVRHMLMGARTDPVEPEQQEGNSNDKANARP